MHELVEAFMIFLFGCLIDTLVFSGTRLSLTENVPVALVELACKFSATRCACLLLFWHRYPFCDLALKVSTSLQAFSDEFHFHGSLEKNVVRERRRILLHLISHLLLNRLLSNKSKEYDWGMTAFGIQWPQKLQTSDLPLELVALTLQQQHHHLNPHHHLLHCRYRNQRCCEAWMP